MSHPEDPIGSALDASLSIFDRLYSLRAARKSLSNASRERLKRFALQATCPVALGCEIAQVCGVFWRDDEFQRVALMALIDRLDGGDEVSPVDAESLAALLEAICDRPDEGRFRASPSLVRSILDVGGRTHGLTGERIRRCGHVLASRASAKY
jgi:hypothetical protein